MKINNIDFRKYIYKMIRGHWWTQIAPFLEGYKMFKTQIFL